MYHSVSSSVEQLLVKCQFVKFEFFCFAKHPQVAAFFVLQIPILFDISSILDSRYLMATCICEFKVLSLKLELRAI